MSIYKAQKVNGDTNERGVEFYFSSRKKAVKFLATSIEIEGEEITGKDVMASTTLIHGSGKFYGVVDKLLIHK